ncbi:MAG: EamA family transporter, partial [Burkholderiales bacterium]|nr:EamA family transporter [Burkholderiales bacterium]
MTGSARRGLLRWVSGRGYLLMAITAVLWSGNAVIGRAVHETMPPVALNFWRWIVTLPVFAVLAWPHLREDWPLVRRHWPILFLFAILIISVYNTFAYIGLNTTTAINMLLINTTRPVIIVLLSYAFFRERPSALQAAGFLLALCGTLGILARGDLEALVGVRFIAGDLWVVAATVAWALYTVLYPKRPSIHPTSLMFVTIVMGLAVLLPFFLWENLRVRTMEIEPQTFWAIGYLGLIAGGIGYVSYNRVVEVLGA